MCRYVRMSLEVAACAANTNNSSIPIRLANLSWHRHGDQRTNCGERSEKASVQQNHKFSKINHPLSLMVSYAMKV